MAAALPARIRQALGGQVADLALAVVLAVFAVLDVLFSDGWRGPVAANVVVMPAAALALTWRRTRPLTSLAAIVACFSGLAIAFGSGESWSSVFIYVTAVYSAVVYGQSPLAAAALTAVGIAVVSVTSPTIDSLGEALWSPSLAILTIGVGMAGRAIRARTGALEQRAEDARPRGAATRGRGRRRGAAADRARAPRHHLPQPRRGRPPGRRSRTGSRPRPCPRPRGAGVDPHDRAGGDRGDGNAARAAGRHSGTVGARAPALAGGPRQPRGAHA